jgi:hypothetical protein
VVTVIVEALSKAGTRHRIIGGVKDYQTNPYRDRHEAIEHLTRIGWTIINVVRG